MIVGVGSNEDNLVRARIDRARGFVSAVSSDAENLYIVLTARGCRSDLQIIARASEDDATSKLLRAGATQVLSPYSSFVGNRIAQLFLRPNVLDFIDTAFGTERLDIEIGEVKIPERSALAGKNLADSMIRQRAGVIVLAVKSAAGKMTFNPPDESVIRAGDCLIVIGGDDRLKKLEDMAAATFRVSSRFLLAVPICCLSRTFFSATDRAKSSLCRTSFRAISSRSDVMPRISAAKDCGIYRDGPCLIDCHAVATGLNSGGHLNCGQKGVETVQRTGAHGHPYHRQRSYWRR